jgi:hypothetical protein
MRAGTVRVRREVHGRRSANAAVAARVAFTAFRGPSNAPGDRPLHARPHRDFECLGIKADVPAEPSVRHAISPSVFQ